MVILVHVIIGSVMSFLGFLPPGMINMTAVKQSIENGLPYATRFSLGAATTVAIQAAIALFFAKLLVERPIIIQTLQYAAIPIFLLLAWFFYRQGTQKVKEGKSDGQKAPYRHGLGLAALNTIAIPFYLGYSTVFADQGWVQLQFPYTLYIVVGAMLGSFLLFYTYSRLAGYIAARATYVARNINFILSGFFVVLAVVMVVKQLVL